MKNIDYFPTLNDLKIALSKYVVKSKNQYWNMVRNGRLKNFPMNPQKDYLKDWKSWIDFLSASMFTYKEFETYVRALKLTTLGEINYHAKMTDVRIPRNFSQFYKGVGWVDMPTLLGEKRLQSVSCETYSKRRRNYYKVKNPAFE